MESCSNKFLDVLESAAVREVSLEVRDVFQRLSMDVIVSSAFGIHTNIQQSQGDTEEDSILHEAHKSMQQFRTGWLDFFISCFPEFGFLWSWIVSLRARFMKLPTDNIKDGMVPIINMRRSTSEVSVSVHRFIIIPS